MRSKAEKLPSPRRGPTGCVGYRDDEDHAIHTAVADLQREPTLERLDVVEDGLGLGRAAPIFTPDDGVPGPEIGPDRQRDLGSHHQAGVKSSPKAIQHSLLPGVADRVASWVGVQADVASDGRPDRSKLEDRGPSPAIQDPRHRPARHPACATHGLVAEARGALCAGKLREHAPLVIRGDPGCARDGASRVDIWAILTRAAYPRVH